MASYLRETERQDGLPAIRRSNAWEQPRGGRNPHMDDCLVDRRTVYHPRPPSPTCRREFSSAPNAQEQLRFMKEEIAKKDRLITQLSSMETPRVRTTDISKIEEMYTSERITANATLKSELCSLQAKCERLQSQIHQQNAELQLKDEKLKDLCIVNETGKECEMKHAAVAQELRAKLMEYEAQAGNVEGMRGRSELAIQTLQMENQVLQEKVLSLEGSIKSRYENHERLEQSRIASDARYEELRTALCSMLQCDDFTGSSVDSLSSRVRDIVQENAMLRSRMHSFRSEMETTELENKASRETIMRLVSETEREQKCASQYTGEMDNLRLERDHAVTRAHDMEREIDLMRDRIDSTQRAWSATKRELEEKEARYVSYEREVRERQAQVHTYDTQLRTFKESVAALLSDSYISVEPMEERIRDRITSLTLAVKDKSAHIDMLEAKMSEMATQMESQYEIHRSAERRAKRSEADFLEMEERTRKFEGELASADMMREGLRTDKERYFRFLERVAHAMKLDPITSDIGLDHITDSIIVRAEQLTKLEADAIVDRKTHIYNLQRKVKSYKEQLESKDLHMELLRKKLAATEERLLGSSSMSREKDEEYVKNRKLVKLVDRYKRELNEAHLELRDLKSRLLESSDIRNQTLHQEREIENLESKVGQLEHVRVRQAEKISGLKSTVEETEGQLNEKRQVCGNSIQALSSELRTTKGALNEVGRREKQLLELRQVISRMLGLDVNTLAVPDFEIISRLEKLILANQSNAATAIALDTTLTDMEDGFRAGYEDASRAINTVARTRSPGRRTVHVRTRPRSASPTRKRDTRAY